MSALISVAELVALRASRDDVVVVDASVILPSAQFDGDYRSEPGTRLWEAERIPGSIHLDIVDELADHDAGYHYAPVAPDELAARLAARGIGADTLVVAYDQGDQLWASRLWWTLRWIGVETKVLDGGLPAWRASQPTASSPADPADAPAPVAPWTVREVRDQWVSIDEVAAISCGDADATLVCGLNWDGFAGTVPSRYARRGHIPGSVNVPARPHVEDGFLRDRDELARQWTGVTQPIVLYCGGGISASLNALALHELGITDVKMYDGSIEEWALDPTRELVTLES